MGRFKRSWLENRQGEAGGGIWEWINLSLKIHVTDAGYVVD